MAIVLIAVLLLLCFLLARIVYKKLLRGGKNPWAWSIVTFVATAVTLLGAGFVAFLYMFSFER